VPHDLSRLCNMILDVLDHEPPRIPSASPSGPGLVSMLELADSCKPPCEVGICGEHSSYVVGEPEDRWLRACT